MGGTRKWWPSAAAFTAYRVAWIALFVLAVIGVGYGNLRDELRVQHVQRAGADLGMMVFLNPAADGLLFAPLGSEGERIGYQFGDLLTAIDSAPLPSDFDAGLAALSGKPGSVVRLDVRHPDGRKETLRVARDPDRLRRSTPASGISYGVRRWIAFAVLLLANIAGLLAALLLFLRNTRDKVAQLLSFSLVLSFADVTVLTANVPGIVPAVLEVSSALLLTLAVLLFPEGRLRSGWQWLALGSMVLYGAMELTLYTLSTFTLWALAGGALSALTVLLAVADKLRRTPAGIARQQTKWVLFGIAVFCVLRICESLLVRLQEIFVHSDVFSWIVLFSHLSYALSQLAIPAGLLVSLLRFRLYDTESAISRSVAFGALTIMLLAIFTGSEKMIEILGERYMGEGLGALSGGLATAIAAVMVAPLHHRVTRWAERRFQGNLIHLRNGLPTLVADLRETVEPAVLGDAVLARVEPGVRATHGAVVRHGEVVASRDIDTDRVHAWLAGRSMPDDDFDRLHVDRDEAMFPMRIPLHADGVGLAGWLLLGPRPDGSFYGKDERDVLMALADPVARALAIALERHARRRHIRQELDWLARRQVELEAVLHRLSPTGSLIGSAPA